jgi:hypothetical protein
MKIRGPCLIVSAFLLVTARGDLTIVQKIEGSVRPHFSTTKLDPLSEAEFSVPKDFQELKGPNFREMLAEKPSVTPSKKS